MDLAKSHVFRHADHHVDMSHRVWQRERFESVEALDAVESNQILRRLAAQLQHFKQCRVGKMFAAPFFRLGKTRQYRAFTVEDRERDSGLEFIVRSQLAYPVHI